ncbi:hypothetical protein D3C73_1235680 [compost metagenome]
MILMWIIVMQQTQYPPPLETMECRKKIASLETVQLLAALKDSPSETAHTTDLEMQNCTTVRLITVDMVLTLRSLTMWSYILARYTDLLH